MDVCCRETNEAVMRRNNLLGVAALCLLAPAAFAQGSGMGPDNGADPQSMSAASNASRQKHHRTVMSGHEGMSHTEMLRQRGAGRSTSGEAAHPGGSN